MGLRLRGGGAELEGPVGAGSALVPGGLSRLVPGGREGAPFTGYGEYLFWAMVNGAPARGGPCSRAGGFAFSGGRPASTGARETGVESVAGDRAKSGTRVRERGGDAHPRTRSQGEGGGRGGLRMARAATERRDSTGCGVGRASAGNGEPPAREHGVPRAGGLVNVAASNPRAGRDTHSLTISGDATHRNS